MTTAFSIQLEKKLLHYMGKAIAHYHMIEAGDRVLVCLSGGKDSFTLVELLERLRQKARLTFDIAVLTLDQAHPGWDDRHLRAWLEKHALQYQILKKDTLSIVKSKIPEGKTYCSLCSRLRRGIIYRYAKEHGFNKIALGHHRDDLIESLLMSIFYNGKIASMPPKLLSNTGEHIVIRPLVYCQEKDIHQWAQIREYPIIPCNLCGSQDNLARQRTKRLIQQLSQDNPKIPSNLLHALQNIHPSHLMDQRLWNFRQLAQNSAQQSETVLESLDTEEGEFVL
jgi:tRNA 2-thiocytidine biosynthesis protein TtcA